MFCFCSICLLLYGRNIPTAKQSNSYDLSIIVVINTF